jgi:two-component system, OmpR family, sensor histidine kinase TctE
LASSLRGRLLRMLLPPIAALLVAGAVGAYFLSVEPASEAYDQALGDVALALGERIRAVDGVVSIDLPGAAEQVLRIDKYDTIYYHVRGPDGARLAGDPGLPRISVSRAPEDGVIAYADTYRGQAIRGVALLVPCGSGICTVQVAETTNKRRHLARQIVLSSLVPQLLVALLTLAVVWFAVKRGLAPLEVLSQDIRARSARDLRPIDPGHAPDEARPLVGALNQLFGQVAEAGRNQQRFLANAAHQLRTPIAGLQAHAELALAQPATEAVRAELAQVHTGTVRTARLANQLLALARAEPGGYSAQAFTRINLRRAIEEAAEEWVRRALGKEIDLGFELQDVHVTGDPVLLREALANLVHNAIESAPPGSRVTVRSGARDGRTFVEVDDEGPGIP